MLQVLWLLHQRGVVMLSRRQIVSETFTEALMTRARESVPTLAQYIEDRRRRGIHALGSSYDERGFLL